MLDAGRFVIEALLDEGLITPGGRDRALAHAQKAGVGAPEALVALGLVSGRDVAITRARLCELPFVDLAAFEVDFRNASLLPRRTAEDAGAFPLFVIDGVATVAMLDPLSLQDVDQVRRALRLEVDPVLCEPDALRGLIARCYSLVRTLEGSGSDEREEELTRGDEPAVAAVNQIIAAAVEAGASDVHVSPDDGCLQLRYRVDGALRQQQAPPLSAHASIVQRLKVMARLDVTQTRRPQDGKFRFDHRGRPVDIRLSVVPTVHGENAVLRILRSASSIGSLDDLGMPPAVREAFAQATAQPHGMLLVTGPTGSGKTTTLYAALARLNTTDRNLVTVEDPVEIRLPGVRQIQANPEIGLTFAAALRSVLRQDPDVILVGEVRDEDTARIAVQSALTGHLVLSTLHTNDAAGAVPRLRDLGVPAFATAGSLLGVLAQRLVRCVCPACARLDAEAASALAELGLPCDPNDRFLSPGACPACMSTGYKGRTGVYELLRATPKVRALIEADAPAADLEAAAAAEGFRPMLDDGFDKARLGVTTLEELRRLRAAVAPSLAASAAWREAA